LFSTAGIKTFISPVKVPVNSITLFEDSAVGSALFVDKVTSASPATDFDKYPALKASTACKFVFVF